MPVLSQQCAQGMRCFRRSLGRVLFPSAEGFRVLFAVFLVLMRSRFAEGTRSLFVPIARFDTGPSPEVPPSHIAELRHSSGSDLSLTLNRSPSVPMLRGL